MHRSVVAVVACILLICTCSVLETNATRPKSKTIEANVVFNVGTSKSGLGGTLKLTQTSPNSPVFIKGTITGLEPNSIHGFHVHESGDVSNGCDSTGSHYNPDKHSHGAKEDTVRHAGDLGNIEADGSGEAIIDISDSHISLSGPKSILGRAFVVHKNEDDLGKGGHAQFEDWKCWTSYWLWDHCCRQWRLNSINFS
jgi:Cu-Zn family superoxide dismutase